MIIVNGLDISDLVTEQRRSSDKNQAPEKLEVTAVGVKFSVGDSVTDIQEGKTVFIGYIFESKKSRSGGNSFVAYSVKKYLIKNYESGDFRDMTASALIKKLCAGFGIPAGSIEDTGITIPTLIFENETLVYDIMLIALNETVKRGGGKFVLDDKSGAIELKRKKENVTMLMFEEKNNIIDAESSESIEDMYNVVKVMGSGDKKLNTVMVSDDSLVAKYGKMQKIEMPSVQTSAEMQAVADSALAELAKVVFSGSITVLDIPEVDAGKGIIVYDSATDLMGQYYVDAITHDEKEKTMQITLTSTDELPGVEYSPPTDDKKTKKDKKSAGKDEINAKVSQSTWEEILKS